MQSVESTKIKHTRLRITAVLLFVFVGLSAMAAGSYAGSQYASSQKTIDKTLSMQINDAVNETIHNGISLGLNVTVTNHGQRVASVYQPHDLIVNNFYKWLIALLDNAQSSQDITASLTNTANSAVTPYVWSYNPTSGFGNTCFGTVFNCQATAGQGGLIEVGTVSTPAARTDYNLGSAFQTYFYTSSVCSTGTTDSVLISGSENANSGTTITESGLFYQASSAASGVTQTFILAHDVFSGISVTGGNTITVQYTWSLNNAGFNYNLCELLAGYFTQPNGAGGQIKAPTALMIFYDTVGRNVSWSQHCQGNNGAGTGYGSSSSAAAPLVPLVSGSPTSSYCANWATNDPTNAMQIAIGTGSTPFTPTTRSLTNFYAENYITTTTYDGAGNAYQTANILLATGATISEAAIYMTLPKGCVGYSPNHGAGGSCVTAYTGDTIMLLAATFAPQVVGNGISIGITFQESG